jgi:phospholipid/cholesterol/gamma-HCH transport system substrate-binding protein
MRGALVGAFVVLGLALFAGGLFLIGDRRLLFADQFELNAAFGRVTGLRVGTGVRLAGIDAGEVLEIRLPSRPSERFVVRMRLREDLRQLVRTDSVAAIQTDGIVGNAFVQIGVGSEEAAVVSSGDTLTGRDPVEIADLIEEGRTTFRTVSSEVLLLRDDVSTAIQTLTDTARTATGLLSDVGSNVEQLTETSTAVVRRAEATLAEANVMVSDIRSGQGTIGRLLTDDTLYQRVLTASQDVEQAVRNLRETTDHTRDLVAGFAGRDGTVQQIALTFRSALADVQEATSDLAEGTEALKRNFLFRGFFRDRGFFDLDSVSRESYQAGALERDRTAIRIWIDASVLFTADPASDVERLTADGRRRLDSAMADLVRYPRDSPLVVEGYAERSAAEAAFLQSVDRAQLVRDYLLSRFRRQATLTDIMPMGADAVGSPRGDNRWSGVALTMFVHNDVLNRMAPNAATGSASP